MMFEGADEGADDLLRAAAGARPVDGVRDGGEHEAEGGGARAVERHDGVSGATGEEGAGGVGGEAGANEVFARAEREQAETCGAEEVPRIEMPDGTEEGADESFVGERAEELHPRARVGAEMLRGGFDRAIEHGGGAIGEGMSERVFGPGPLEAELLEIDVTENRRQNSHRVDGGAGVVNEVRQRERGGAAAAAGRGGGFDEVDGESGAREEDGARQTVGAAADDDDIGSGRSGSDAVHRRIHQASSRIRTGRSFASRTLTGGRVS